MTIRQILLAAPVLAVPLAIPLAATAQPAQGLYVALSGGANFMHSETINSAAGFSLSGVTFNTNPGGVGALGLGWGYGNGFRAEMEFSYRYNSLDQIRTPIGNASLGGHEQKYGLMANVYYDFPAVLQSVAPYVGVGAGYQWANISVSALGLSASGTAGSAALQAMVGAAMPISSVPGLSLTAEYRFMGMPWNRDYGSGIKVSDDYNHAIMIGVRYAFGGR